jgi:polysaccharide export outer membrane protein
MRSVTSRCSALAVILAAAVGGCANLGPYVWGDDYRDPREPSQPGAYVLGVGDSIAVSLFAPNEAFSTKAKIRHDGKITMPLLNDVQAEGYEPAVLARQLEVRLKDFTNNPRVSVSVEEARSLRITVFGRVITQGVLTVPLGTSLVQVLATAGGVQELAHDDRIFVVRREPQLVRIRFRYDDLLRSRGAAPSFRLRTGDEVIVD